MSAVLAAQEPTTRYLEAVQPALVRQFEMVANAPGGVALLRELILSLAVQGKLMSQDQHDEPASALLGRIHIERRRLVSESETERAKLSSAVADDEVPYPLPETWAWARLPTVYYSISPSNKKLPSSAVRESGRHPVVDQGQSHIAGYTDEDALLIRLPGPVVVFGDHTKNIKFIDFDFVAGADGTKILRPLLINERFFALQLRSYRLADRGYARHFKVLNSQLFAVAPIAEQARIVARVDELMRLCDALEAKGRLEAEQHARLLGTLLGTLTDSSTPQELAANWQRVADHFDLLLDRPEAVDALEQTILQLAVRGLLAPRGLWTKSRFGDVVAMLNGYAFKSEWFRPSGIRLVRNVNVSHGSIDWHQTACVSTAIADEFAQFTLAEGDVVLTLDRPIISTGLKLAVVQAHDLPCLLLQRVARLSPDTSVLSREFMLLWLCSDNFVKAIDPGRSNGVPHISTKQVAALTIDLPPLAEQSRIVARVAELRRHCANLRQRLAASQTTQSHLAEALVKEVA